MTASTTEQPQSRQRPGVALRTLVIVGLFVSLLVAGGLSYFASEHPDGLEHVAETLGFDDAAQDSAVADSPLADYGTAGVDNAWLSTAISGAAGLLITGVVAFALMRLLARRRADAADPADRG